MTIDHADALEVLYAARASIADTGRPYEFGDWCHCTCGHIYAAATGTVAVDERWVEFPRDPAYTAVLAAAADALGAEPDLSDLSDPSWLATFVSDQTAGAYYERPEVGGIAREDGVASLTRIIDALEAQQARDAQARQCELVTA